MTIATKKGYYLIKGKSVIFMETNNARKSKKIIDGFIAYLYSLIPRQEPLSLYLDNEPLRKDIAYRVVNTTLSHKVTDNGAEYIELKNKYETCCYPLADKTIKFVFI